MAATKGKKLTDRQRRFVDEYMLDLNAKAAAIRAGYSEKNAESLGYQLLQKTPVKQALIEATKARSERVQIDADWVLARLKLISDSCSKMDENGKLYDSAGANRATELIGRHLAMFVERKELTGRDGGPIELVGQIATLPDDELARMALALTGGGGADTGNGGVDIVVEGAGAYDIDSDTANTDDTED